MNKCSLCCECFLLYLRIMVHNGLGRHRRERTREREYDLTAVSVLSSVGWDNMGAIYCRGNCSQSTDAVICLLWKNGRQKLNIHNFKTHQLYSWNRKTKRDYWQGTLFCVTLQFLTLSCWRTSSVGTCLMLPVNATSPLYFQLLPIISSLKATTDFQLKRNRL